MSARRKGGELEKALKGVELDTSRFTRLSYARSASIFWVEPVAVAYPKSVKEVARAVKACLEVGLPVAARGAGSSIAGQCLTRGLVLDFSRHMSRILEVNPNRRRAKVEPGVVLSRLNEALSPEGLFFPPDPSSAEFCTVGGMAAVNSSGARFVRYGSTKRWVRSVKVVLSTGDVVELRRDGWKAEGKAKELLTAAEQVVGLYREVALQREPKVEKNSSGYALWEAAKSGSLLPVFIGSDGTLGIFVELELDLLPSPKRRACLFSFFNSEEGAAEAALSLLELSPVAAEMVDRTLLELARYAKLPFSASLPEDARAFLIVEFEGEEERELRSLALEAERRLRSFPGALEVRAARDDAEAEEIWKFRRSVVPLLHRQPGPVRPVAIVEDLGFPPERLPEAMGRVRETLKKFGLQAAFYGSMLDGNLHCRPMVDTRWPELKQFLLEVAKAVFEETVKMEGTISSEHGDGLSKAPFLELMYGPELLSAFWELKRVLDPEGILNPGSKVSEDPEGPFSSLVFWGESAERAMAFLGKAEEETRRCNACGLCREACPLLQVDKTESLSPRARMTLALALLSGKVGKKEKGAKEPLRLCLHCLKCSTVCPSGVDPAWADVLMLSSLAPHRGPRARVLSSPRLAARLSSLPLFEVTKRGGMWLLGISAKRPLTVPSFEPIEPLPVEGPLAEVAYFPGCYAALFNPSWARAALALLNEAKVEVKIVFEGCCGAPAIAKGRLEQAMKSAQKAAKALLREVEAGRKVVLSDPTCLTMIRHHWSRLLGEMGEKVAENCFEVAEFVLSLPGGLPERWQGVAKGKKVLLHLACHLSASGAAPAQLRLLSEAEAQVCTVDACCGLAGSWGMMRENHCLSLQVGEKLFKVAERFNGPILTLCGSCRDQIEFATGKKALHSILWLWGLSAERGHA